MSAYGSQPVVTTYCPEQHHVSSFCTDCLPTCLTKMTMVAQVVMEGEEDKEVEEEVEQEEVEQEEDEVEQEEKGLEITSR